MFIPTKRNVSGIKAGIKSVLSSSDRVNDLLDLQEATYVVPYMMASGAVVSRGVIGPGFDIVPAELGSEGNSVKREQIIRFFNYMPSVIGNFKDLLGPLAKLYTTAFMYRMFGHAAWQIVYEDGNDLPVGFDLIPGIVKPNTHADGRFKTPAYTQYLRAGSVVTKTEFANASNIVYFCVPDFRADLWLAEPLALSDYSLPSEIYAARAYKSLHENRNAPLSGIWYVPSDIDDDTFDRFVAEVEARYTGSSNYGKNPIIMRGEGGFKSLSLPREDAPYIEGRELNRKEVAAASGVPGPKYGTDLESTSATALGEIRLEFYESTLRPVMQLIEEAIYGQIIVRVFNAPEWRFKFNRPDFTTAVEDASIELRRIQWGQWSPNEARASRGEAPREDGDYYLQPLNMIVQGDGTPGPPDDDAVDDDQGDMKPGDEDSVPGTDQPVIVEGLVDELRKWRKFELRVAKGDRYKRAFVTENVPGDLYDFIRQQVVTADGDVTAIRLVFDDAIEMVAEFEV